MSQHDVEAFGKWGADLIPIIGKRKVLVSLLTNFYAMLRGKVACWGDKDPKRLVLAGKFQKQIEKLMVDALQNSDVAFFEDLSKLIPLTYPGNGASPVEHVLLSIWSLRDPERQDEDFEEQGKLLPEGKLRDEMDLMLLGLHRIAENDFPEWPASVSEFHDHLRKVGFTWTKKTIRDAIKKMNETAGLGFPVRPDPPGRKRKPKDSGGN